MEFDVSPELRKELGKIKKLDKKLATKIEKQLQLFLQDHQHPSLRLHKLTGEQRGVWSVSVDMKIRMLYLLENNTAYFFDIGTHDEVYRSK